MLPFRHIYNAPSENGGGYYAWFAAMHTRVDIMLLCRQNEDLLNAAVSEIYDTVADIEAAANCFSPASELHRVNRDAFSQDVKLSPMLSGLLKLCLDMNKKTQGLFDIATDSENFDSQTIKSVKIKDDKIRFLRAGIKLNLSGMLKGFALEKIRGILRRRRIGNALVSLGTSSIMALGGRGSANFWTVSLEQTGERVNLQNECITTSGNSSDSRIHIVNPLTGKPIEGKGFASVITDDGVAGEILATCLCIAEEDESKDLMKRLGGKRYFRGGMTHRVS